MTSALPLREVTQGREMLGHRDSAEFACAMDLQRLLHGLGAESGIGFALRVLDRVDGTAGEEQNTSAQAAVLLYHPLPYRLLELPFHLGPIDSLPLNPLLVGTTFLLLLWEKVPSVAIVAVALLAGALLP